MEVQVHLPAAVVDHDRARCRGRGRGSGWSRGGGLGRRGRLDHLGHLGHRGNGRSGHRGGRPLVGRRGGAAGGGIFGALGAFAKLRLGLCRLGLVELETQFLDVQAQLLGLAVLRRELLLQRFAFVSQAVGLFAQLALGAPLRLRFLLMGLLHAPQFLAGLLLDGGKFGAQRRHHVGAGLGVVPGLVGGDPEAVGLFVQLLHLPVLFVHAPLPVGALALELLLVLLGLLLRRRGDLGHAGLEALQRLLQVAPFLLGDAAGRGDRMQGQECEQGWPSKHGGIVVVERERWIAYSIRPPLRRVPIMRENRYLGSIWASVHGPHDARRLLVWTLDARFAGLGYSPGPRPLDPAALAAAATDLPVRFPVVRVGSVLAQQPVTAGLGSAKDGERLAALSAVKGAVHSAQQFGCQLVVLEPGLVPVLGEIECDDLGDSSYAWTHERAAALLARRHVGRNPAVERACRGLFEVLRAFPDMHFALCGGRNLRAVADVAALQDIFADLHHPRLGYWHDAAVAARREQVLGEPAGQWLEEFGNRLLGMSLGDANPDGMYLPPGAGGVDYGMLTSYLPRQGRPVPMVLELDPSVAPNELAGMLACLEKHGL